MKGKSLGRRVSRILLALALIVEALAGTLPETVLKAQAADPPYQAADPVLYQAWDAGSGTVKDVVDGCRDYTEITDPAQNEWGDYNSVSWYVLKEDKTFSSRIWVNGTVHLILCDGATLTAENGISVLGGYTLNIYAQSSGSSMGAVNATVSTSNYGYAGIGGGASQSGGTINIHGGNITAAGSSSGAGIGGGTGEAGGNVNIYGGIVTAIGGSNSAGIGGGSSGAGGNVFIYGGYVCASGGGNAHGIGGGYYHVAAPSDGSLTLGEGMVLYGNDSSMPEGSGTADKLTGTTERYKYMMAFAVSGGGWCPVGGVTLNPGPSRAIIRDEIVEFTAVVAPDGATDKKVKWSVTGEAVSLYSDAACNTQIVTDTATDTLTVYAKGTATGKATVTVMSNSDAGKTSSCVVSVKYQGDPYATMVNQSSTVVGFNDLQWYVIEDNSTAANEGTLTLLAKDPIGQKQFDSNFNDSEESNSYSISEVKAYLDGLADGTETFGSSKSFKDAADAIKAVDLTVKDKDGNEKGPVAGAQLYLLSVEEALAVPKSIRNCGSGKSWWLRSPGSENDEACIVKDDGDTGWSDCHGVSDALVGLRPALQLDLSKVIFNPDGNTFTLPITSLTLDKTADQTIIKGNNISFTAVLTPGTAVDGKVKWSVGGSKPGAVKLYSDASCTTEVGTNATSVLTVYAKGISTGSATVTVTSNSDAGKTSSCEVTVQDNYISPYEGMVNNSDVTVKFNGLDWYIIEDSSTAVDVGTVTLLAKDPIDTMAFDFKDNDEDELSNSYNASDVKAYLDGLIDGSQTFGESKSFKDVAAAIKKTDLITYAYNSNTDVFEETSKAKLYLLSVDEALKAPDSVRKCNAWWWLRSPGFYPDHACVVIYGGSASWDKSYGVDHVDVGLRPALQLNLESVIFDSSSEGATFTLKPAPVVKIIPEALSLSYNGSEQVLVTAGEAEGGTLYYALGENAETAPDFDGDSEAADKKWSTELPKASAAGTYYVWYMVKGDAAHCNIEEVCIPAEIKAQTAPPVSDHTIRFEMNGHGNAVSAQSIRSGGKVRRPDDPVDAAYDFVGWYTDKECTKEYDFNKKVTKSFTLYAKWTEKAAESFTVSFDMNGHGTAIADMSVKSGGLLSRPAPDPVDDEYDFGGWYTDKECTQEYDFSQKVTESFTLYAKWTKKTEPGPGPAICSALDPIPLIEAGTTELYLVKGQKFIIGKDWGVKKDDKTSKALVSISKKSGQLKAKKEGTATIWNGERSLVLHISAPSVPKKLSLQITADGAESRAIELKNPDELPVYWFSATPDVAVVDQDGNVTAVSAGKAKVTAYINGSAYNCSVSVKEAVPAKERTLHMAVGAKKNLSIKGVKNPLWSSADEEIASFDKKKLTANKAGETTLTATAADGTEYLVHLFVEDLSLSGEGLAPQTKKNGRLIANKYTLTIKAGESTELSFDAVDQAVLFKSSKPDSAFIDENGKVTACAAGRSKFTAKVDGKTITVTVIVEQ